MIGPEEEATGALDSHSRSVRTVGGLDLPLASEMEEVSRK